MIYPVHSIFHTLQGEGHFVGYPAVFIRLAGCSLWGAKTCRIWQECDTEPSRVAERLTEAQIVQRCCERVFRGVAVITGGEPTDYDLVPLLAALMGAGFRVHLETSGVRAVTGLPFEWITVSPKSRPLVQTSGHALKLVVRPETTAFEVEVWGQEYGFLHYYLQPMTVDGVAVNLPQVIGLLQSEFNHKGKWALSTQAHRGWGLL